MQEAPKAVAPLAAIRIGVVARGLAADPNTRGVVAGVIETVRAHGGSVMCFELDGVGDDFDAFVGTGNVDGYVVLLGSLTRVFGQEALEKFCERRRPLPIAAVAGRLASTPTVRVDNAGGVRKAVAHLVDKHGRRKIAFLCESEAAAGTDERLAGYRQGLADKDIGYDPRYVVEAVDFQEASVAVRMLLDDRHLELEAIVAFNDTVAFGAMTALIDRGLAVPQQIAVVGSADIVESGDVIPPLTTIAQNLEEQGRQAATFVLDAFAGKTPPSELVLETELIVRRSCGCFPETVYRGTKGPEDPSALSAPGSTRLDDLVVEMTHLLGAHHAEGIERMAAGFTADLEKGTTESFIAALDEELTRTARSQAAIQPWLDALVVMRRRVLPRLGADAARLTLADVLWREARNLVSDMARRAPAYHRILDARRARTLGGISRSLITINDIQELTNVLSQNLPSLDVKSCYMSLFDGRDAREWSTLVVGIDAEGGLASQFGDRFRSNQLVPEGVLPVDRGYTVVVMPLAFKSEQFGIILLEVDPSQSTAYDELRGQFGAAFERMERERELVFLHEAQRERADELERAHAALREHQEKLLLAESMASLGRLTAGMAHEMNTPLAAVRAALGELLLLIDEYKASVDAPDVTSQDHRDIAKEMHASAKLADSAAQRVAGFVRSIKAETRDLSSQDHRRFDAVQVIRDALLLLNHAARSANCTVDLQSERQHMDLFGSPGRFVQIVTNLVTNAIDASVEKGGGPVTLRLADRDGGLEMRVTDRGTGIPAENMDRIFEPMYTSKPFGVGTGLGLPIVRDLTTGHFSGTVDVESTVGVGTTFVLRFYDHVPSPSPRGPPAP
jgi:DNA-binding LacI/PurR family transcriptional regulator/signal transduction histidine kinase